MGKDCTDDMITSSANQQMKHLSQLMKRAKERKKEHKSMNFLTENKIEYYSELESKIADIMTAHDAAAKAVKEVEQRMSDLSLLIKHTTTYRQLKPIYDEYRKSPDKEKYLRGHESEIILFEAAARALKEMQIKKLPDLAALRKE